IKVTAVASPVGSAGFGCRFATADDDDDDSKARFLVAGGLLLGKGNYGRGGVDDEGVDGGDGGGEGPTGFCFIRGRILLAQGGGGRNDPQSQEIISDIVNGAETEGFARHSIV
ncbi:MAG: hypothetical protein Q9173_003912, partial [Seirophora scorigena]